MLGVVLIAFLAGLAAGSFATAVAHRVPRGISIAFARSQCPPAGRRSRPTTTCRSSPGLLLRGKARCCGARISPRYPLTELAVGAALRRDGARLPPRRRRSGDRPGLRRDAGGRDADRPRAADHPQQGPDRRRVLCLAIAVPTDPGGVPERLIAAAAAGASSSSSPSPIRPAWASATSSWRRRWASSSAAPLPRRSSSPCLPAASSAWPDRPPRRRGPQDGDPLRSVPGPGRASSACWPATS